MRLEHAKIPKAILFQTFTSKNYSYPLIKWKDCKHQQQKVITSRNLAGNFVTSRKYKQSIRQLNKGAKEKQIPLENLCND